MTQSHQIEVLLARIEGDSSFKACLDSKNDPITNLHGVASIAERDGDEGNLVGKIAEIKNGSKPAHLRSVI